MGYLDELNASQRDAVLYNDGPSLVIAGAGSGKTRVLVSKITYLLEQGLPPWSILALTFTNKAAREMKERIALQVGIDNAAHLWAGTFHSLFSRILRTEAQHIGFSPNFTIYDTPDQKSLVKSIVKEMGLDDKVYKPANVLGHISAAKNRLIGPSQYAANRQLMEADRAARMPAIASIYRTYWDRCRNADAMDFDDLLVYTYTLFNDHPEVRQKYVERFRYVLVDEYQDTNYAQHSIVWQLTKENQMVCVVGDDAQSIYSFRGANIDNILNFTNSYTGAKTFKLEQNYRSTQTIVNAANSLIAKNRMQIPKKVFSEKEAGEPICVMNVYSDTEEGEAVMRHIKALRSTEFLKYNDFAILYRTNAQSRIFEEALRKHSMPYRLYGGLSFYQRKDVKDIIAYFRLVVNHNDEEAFKRIINYPARGIGKTTLDKIQSAAIGANVSLWNVICSPHNYALGINNGMITKLSNFRSLIEQLSDGLEGKDAYTVAQDIVKHSGIIADVYQDKTPENMARQENMEELLNGIHSFVDGRREEYGEENANLTEFLAEVSLLSDLDETDEEGDDDKVTLMTVHAAKGLEFNTVFVVGLEENLFPSQMSMDSPRNIEEERRLFYVAITRAERHCFFSFAKSRFRYGKTEFSNPSRFLSDIDSQYLNLQRDGVTSYSAPRPQTIPRRSLFAPQAGESRTSMPSSSPRNLRRMTVEESSTGGTGEQPLHVGQTIEHERFGVGKVTLVEGYGANCKATVNFRNVGEKRLLLKFAKYTVIG